MNNFEQQVAKGWVIIAIAALAVALAVILYFGYSSSAYGSETAIDVPIQSEIVPLPKAITQPVVECDTDLDCMLKNPSPNGDYVDYSSTQIDPDGFMDSEE